MGKLTLFLRGPVSTPPPHLFPGRDGFPPNFPLRLLNPLWQMIDPLRESASPDELGRARWEKNL